MPCRMAPEAGPPTTEGDKVMESSGTGRVSLDKAKARDIIAAIRLLQRIEQEKRPATELERRVLSRFTGFGGVARLIFPNPVTDAYTNPGWQALGEELRSLLTDAEYDSAKRTTVNAFYTSPVVMAAMHEALSRFGIPVAATVLEPGCGIGNFMSPAPKQTRFIGVELDGLSGRLARAIHPDADIRIESFADSKLPQDRIDAVIGNVPFADKITFDWKGQRFSIHDYFFAKSLDGLKPGGIMALVTSHFTLDKVNTAIREQLAGSADFLGAIRLPSDAFDREGTKVVTDIVFLRKRLPGEKEKHADPDWLKTEPISIEDAPIDINKYFLNHPEMVLGTWSRKNRLYKDGYSLMSNGDLAQQLREAIARLPKNVASVTPSLLLEPAKPTGFVPPPPLNHITEGSFFVGDGRVIHQVEDGVAMPVTYGGTLLKADGTMSGKRTAALIGLRDHARRVLQSQNEGWPEAERDKARRNLNIYYDLFTSVYGPINKTTFSKNADGTMIRRMPNLAKFREDPDAMLVMSLEEYDEVTGKADKAAIMKKDVVGRTPEITSVATAEEGLLVSLNQRGAVDLPYICQLYGQLPDRVIEELGDLIYREPETNTWQTADVYLSGNVRRKLAQAKDAGPVYARNVEALEAVQPEDVLPGDIDANLGAPWIPVTDIQAFAAELFGVSPSSIPVTYLKQDALWMVAADHSVEQSVPATADYGTGRANGAKLFELALNMKSPVIYDRDADDKPVVNPSETLMAKEKQKLIKEKFRSWVFSDPDRTERLVRLYNDTYNNLRPRQFDGSHLSFPGMNKTIALRPHQEDAVWRGMSSGNTLLAHVVGAGKTFTMAATGMKKKQAGLIKKPMFVVPNHMLEQFAREFMQLYPTAKLLIATKDDLARERRKRLTAKIASGEWDGIIVTHSSFERIGMSRGYQAEFLRQQIAEYDHLLLDAARSDEGKAKRNLLKTIEKQKAAREERLKDLLATDKKDDGLVFDELGVDYLFIDESHYFKNLETPTKMERVAGIQTGGSERAFDLYMKSQYLHRQHPGHGVTFATGTPISNTMVEMYNIQRFLDPEGLKSRGIEHFDGWAANFGEIVDTMEIAPDGASLRPRSRFAKFINLPELQQMFRAFADVPSPESMNLPKPKLETGKAITIACPMSDEQKKIQDSLVARYERVRSGGVDPRQDNALAITTDGRKLALDARLLSSTAGDHAGSKINALVEKVTSVWQRTAPTRGTQLVFCDMGVHPTPWGYCVYDDIVQKLVATGIPREQIAAIGDADSDAKKQALFDKVRSGAVRVLIGSTSKMGTGTNVQKRLAALHHLDAPWKPAEVEQRDGRILRQGNSNEEVAIYRYVTEGSFDAYMWQALENKARFIAQVMSGTSGVRRAEDIGGQELSYAEVKAIASGNPAVLTLAEADAELQRLAILKRNHADEQYVARRNLRELPETIDRLTKRATALEADIKTIADHADDRLTIGNRCCLRDEALDVLAGRLRSVPESVREPQRVQLGVIRGLRFGLWLRPQAAPELFIEGALTRHETLSREHHGPRAILNAADRLIDSYAAQLADTRQDVAVAETQHRDYQARLGTTFTHEQYLSQMTDLRNQLKAVLAGQTTQEGGEPLPSARELAEKIKSLKAANTIEASAGRAESRGPIAAVEPVATRIRRRIPKSPLLAPASDETPVTTTEKAAEPEPTTVADVQPATVEPMLPFDETVFSESVPSPQWCTIARPKRRLERQLSMF
ncbi:MAG TPA: DEAD/DEAH box helicase family protein [Pirellulales bacterium]|nr:DEAD/DEAH box helicase family protein [Pirellulales bacterium]